MDRIAIIGIGCRFPGGAASPAGFWDLLCRGVDAIGDVPDDRWDMDRFYDPDPKKPGKMYVKQAGFLDRPFDQFDPLFFGMSPREAEVLDPQQRLLLMVAWEAIEDAGLPIESLEGSDTGVFIGGFCLDNMILRLGSLSQFDIGSHTGTSSTMAMLANRVSYAFDLRGPSLTVDTACSSSLTATHLACRSLSSGECSVALAGGVSIMIEPGYPIAMSKGGFLSPHCRCMAFDERAAGYARGEGSGAVVLKRLADAQRDGDEIYALIRSSGINQDGRTLGIALPNTHAQETLIREVYRKAGVTPDQISYVEAHGTGTQAGDLAEVRALDAVLREGRGSELCPIGSVKTNIGHLEAAAGIAGLIKAALCLKHSQVPPNLHFETPNPKIPFDKMCVRVPTQIEPLPARRGSETLVGVNSFGYGGTNAHVLLQSWDAKQAVTNDGGANDRVANDGGEAHSSWKTSKKAFVVPVSARHPQPLKELARLYSRRLAATSASHAISLPDFVHTLVHRRSHHRHRMAVIADSHEQLAKCLQRYAEDDDASAAVFGQAVEERPKLMFVYNGMGPQWYAMGRELMAAEPVYRDAVESCDELFAPFGLSVVEELSADENRSRVNRTDIAQATSFALQLGLTKLLDSWGVRPDGVLGHSVGEIAAAHVSGALTLQEGILVSYHRGRLQQSRAGQGAMLAVGLAHDEAEALIDPWAGRVDVAAVNAPSSVTLAGDRDALEEIARLLTENDVFNKFLRVEVAFHSQQMDPLADELLATLSPLRPQRPSLPIYSTVTGAAASDGAFGASYWWDNVRRPVLLSRAIQSAAADGFHTFVEIGPHPALANSIREVLHAARRPENVVATLMREQPERQRLMEAIGRLWCLGHEIDFDAVAPTNGRFERLPTYPWQLESYWRETKASRRRRLGSGRGRGSPLVACRCDDHSVHGGHLWIDPRGASRPIRAGSYS